MKFLCTSHGKTSCDGIGATVKRLATRASLQRPLREHILTPKDLYTRCAKNVKNIIVVFVDAAEVVEATKEQER